MASQNVEKEAKAFVCSNPKCQTSFAAPILVEDLSSEDESPYNACPYCLSKVDETGKEEKTNRKRTAKAPTIEKPEKKRPAKETTLEKAGCSHYFGYLSQRPKSKEMPEECILCQKILDCMLAQLKRDISASETEAKIDEDETAEKPSEKKLKTENENDKETPTDAEPAPTAPSSDQFLVETLGMLYSSWSNTVRIDKETLAEWGKKIKKVEIETADGKKARCKVEPMEGARRTVQIPDKLQSTLEISEGQFVKVKPVKGRK